MEQLIAEQESKISLHTLHVTRSKDEDLSHFNDLRSLRESVHSERGTSDGLVNEEMSDRMEERGGEFSFPFCCFSRSYTKT